MKKKHIISYIVAGLAFAMLQSACKTTDVKPQNEISSEIAFTTPSKIEANVIGVYDGLQDPEFLSGRSLIYSDVLGQDVIATGEYFSSIYQYQMLATDTYAANEWSAGYGAIAKANRVIEGIQTHLDIAGANAKPFIAECEFARALAYFTLVNHYAQPYHFTADASHLGVPLVLKAATAYNPAELVLRNTVKEVYDQIIADLKDAEINLPVSQDDSVQRANTYCASALLSRVYLYMNDYPDALAEANKVILSGKYHLNPNPGDCFGPGNYQTAESIFSIANSLDDNPNTNNALPMHYNATDLGGRNDLVVSKTFLTLPGFALDDKRRGLLYQESPSVGTTITYTNKYPDVTGRADWAPIIRYPEVLLTAAEASVRASGAVDQTSLDRLNSVRDRSLGPTGIPYTLLSFLTPQSFLDAVLLERRIELAFEGHRIGDILRLKQNVTGKENDDYSAMPDEPYGADHLIFPIPAYDVKLYNNKLTQNPGYGN